MVDKNDMVGVRLPPNLIKAIDEDVARGDFISRSEWVRTACRYFDDQRKRDRLGGGGLN